MKKLIVTTFFLLATSLYASAQGEISQLKPCAPRPKLTKFEQRRIKNIVKDVQGAFYNDPIDLFVRVEPKIVGGGKTVAKTKFVIDSHELGWKDSGETGSLLTNLSFFVKITSTDKSFNSCYDEDVSFPFKEEEIKKNTPISFQRTFELASGKYSLFFSIRDTETGKSENQRVEFEIK